MAQENESSGDSQEAIKLLVPTRRKKKAKEKDFDPNGWMVTFGDLITLMMTFFVLLYSFNDPNPKAIEAISSNSPGLFSLSESAVTQPISIQDANSLVKENLEIFLDENSINHVEVSETEEGILITLPTDIAFEKDDAQLDEAAQKAINKVTAYLRKTPHQIRVEGHTDNTAVEGRRFSDKWGLSLARAHAVLQVMLQSGMDPKRMSLIGNGESQPKKSNLSPEGRQDNRRVEIILSPL